MVFFLSLLQSRQEQLDTDGPSSPSITSSEIPARVNDPQPILESFEGELSILPGSFLYLLIQPQPITEVDNLDFEQNIDLELDTPTNQRFSTESVYAIFDPSQSQLPYTPDTSSPSFDTPCVAELDHDLQASDKVHII